MPSATPSFRLHNTLTRRVEPLVPSEADADGVPVLRFYGCGPTVYSYAHIGNFRTFLTADLVVRTAEALGWRVRYVSNVTDVGHLTEDDVADASGEDKLTKALKSKEGERFANVWDLARHYTDALLADWRALNLREPSVRPRATEHLREQILATEALVAGGHAYETADGVYFHVPSFPDYGKLSGNADADALDTGAAAAARQVVVDDEKRDPRDFALWKKTEGDAANAGHLMQWFSPFGWGFPGWHIECSVMARAYLGDTLDLHSGGEDLRFPHHECEIAQSESLTGKPFARHWLHTRFLQVEGEKMAKSRGNFLTVRDLTQPADAGGRSDLDAPHDPLALRLALMAGHYGKPFNFTMTALHSAGKNRQRYREADGVVQAAVQADQPGDDVLGDTLAQAYSEALAAMADDLNTPEALAAAYRGVNAILGVHREGGLSGATARSAAAFLDRTNALLGIVRPETPIDEALEKEADPDFAAKIEGLLQQRQAAREARDFARADALRAELDAAGVVVMDSPTGSTWKVR